jgi:hypothetical protein
MSLANALWGAPRIHGELLKLGIEVSQATVGRYLPWRPKAPSPTWRNGSFYGPEQAMSAHGPSRRFAAPPAGQLSGADRINAR